MSKASTLKALNNFMAKDARKKAPKKNRSTKNKSPEKALVKLLITEAKAMGMELAVVDSAAVFSVSAGCYLGSQTSESLPDLIGDDDMGRVIYLEAKAPGKRSTLKPHQYDFLKRKIERGCFACCSDNPKHFRRLYEAWLDLDRLARARYLLEDLPVPPEYRRASSQGTDIF
jgi:hypothetical protein